jgi:hypothetical protein
MTHRVMTANLLREGEVVYLTAAGAWSAWLEDAEAVNGAGGEGRLEVLAERAVGERTVVGPYLMDVAEEAGRLKPLGMREKIRAMGPTTHPAFGKQAMNGRGQGAV